MHSAAEARRFAMHRINAFPVEQEIRILDHNVSPEKLRYLDKYDLRGLRVG